jgi:hypothetical protein
LYWQHGIGTKGKHLCTRHRLTRLLGRECYAYSCASRLEFRTFSTPTLSLRLALSVCKLSAIRLLRLILTDTGNRVCSFVIIFIEIPLLLRICPTSSKFDTFIRKFSSNYMRAAIYFVMSAVQWISIWPQATSLIAAAVFLMIAAIFYALAGFKGQQFQGSKTLGGQGVAQMII